MSALFSSARSLVTRAGAHLNELDYKKSQFLQAKPYALVSDATIISRVQRLKARFNTPVPDELACITFDAINCLRSALDHAVYSSVSLLTGNPDPPNTKFPFGYSDYASAESEFERGARGVPACIRDFLLDFKPYKGGNRTLWGFNEIRNIKIHRALVPANINVPEVGIGQGTIGNFQFVNDWDSSKNELTYAILTDCNIEVEISIDIAFVQGSALSGQPVLGTLHHVSGIVSSIIDGIEAETARILRSRSVSGGNIDLERLKALL